MAILMAPRNGLRCRPDPARPADQLYGGLFAKPSRRTQAGITRVPASHPAFAYKPISPRLSSSTPTTAAGIAAPTLVIAGADDALLPAQLGKGGRIAGAQLKLIPNASHIFFNQERAAFVAALVPFLQTHPMNPPG